MAPFSGIPPPPPPASELAVYRILSPRAGVRVSPLCLGGCSIGSAWKSRGVNSLSKEDSFILLDEFFALGGNFIDTSNNYQEQESEIWIGEWLKKRGNRDEIVLATKFSSYYKGDKTVGVKVNYGGNGTKSIKLSVQDSLKNLQTSYIDILYIHFWDWTTSTEELMQALNGLVRAGSVLYLGVSDTPAWVVTKANQYARDHGLAQFVVYQGMWNVMCRDLEREIIPMCLAEGMAICPWGAVGSGKFQSKTDLEKRAACGEKLRSVTGTSDQTDLEIKVSAGLEKIGKELGTDSVTAVALAYVLQKVPYVIPLIGGRKVEHLRANITALSLRLSQDQIKELEALAPFDPGFPYDVFGGDLKSAESCPWHLAMTGDFAWVRHPEPIKPSRNSQEAKA